MSAADLPAPLRCPHCHALVVDRRSPVCTTCRAELPTGWAMSAAEVSRLAGIEAKNRAAHLEEMRALSPLSNPNLPPIVRLLDSGSTGNY